MYGVQLIDQLKHETFYNSLESLKHTLLTWLQLMPILFCTHCILLIRSVDGSKHHSHFLLGPCKLSLFQTDRTMTDGGHDTSCWDDGVLTARLL